MIAPATRRGFLCGFAKASAVAGTVAIPLAVRAAPVDDAELLRLGTTLDEGLTQYLDLVAEKARRVEAFKRIEPAIPQEIIRPLRSGRGEPDFYGDAPPDYDGLSSHKVFDHRVTILWPWEARQLTEKWRDGRTRTGKHYRRLRAQCEAYHEAHDLARKAAGLPEVEEARFYKGRVVLDAGFSIAEIQATTMAGLAVKGRAGLAMHRVWSDDGGLRIESSYQKLLENLSSLGEARSCA